MMTDDNTKEAPSQTDGTPHGDASARQQPISDIGDLPTPSVQRSRLLRYLVWIIPLLAIAATLYYANMLTHDHGPTVTISVEDAGHLEEGKTMVRCRGVIIGKVTDVQLTKDRMSATAIVRLWRGAEDFARDGTKYWLVQPDLSGGSLNSLTTVFNGAFIEATPGTGESKSSFAALPRRPSAPDNGLRVELFASKLNDVNPGTAIMYRGVRVGSVTGASLADDATRVTIGATIDRKYAPLVRANTAFWFVPAADLRGDLFSGVEVKLSTLRSLFEGGIAMATPDAPFADAATDDTSFALLSEMPKDAEGWRPTIAISPDADDAIGAANSKVGDGSKRSRRNPLE